MKNTPKSELNGKRLRFIGVAWVDHPTDNKLIQISVYQELKELFIILCTSEQGEPLDIDFVRGSLGAVVNGKEIAKFAARKLDGKFPLDEFKEILRKSYNGSKWFWWQNPENN